MKTVINVDKELFPDCCIACMEILIQDGTLACNCDGCDVLPFQKCENFKRLKYYGTHKEPLKMVI